MALLLAGSMCLTLLSACSGKSSPAPDTATEDTGAEITYGPSEAIEAEQTEGYVAESVNVAMNDPMSFSPLKMTGGTGKAALFEVFETLVDRDEAGGEIYGCLAKDWYWEGTDLYVELYDYISDSAGNHITAEDVVFSYEYPWTQGISSNKYQTYADSIEAVDEYTVVFHWKEEEMDTYNAVFGVLSGQFIFSQEAFLASADEMATTPVGTGPYLLTNFVAGSSATLERRDDYWQTDESLIGAQHKANVQTMNYQFVSDTTQQVNALKAGEIDYVNGIPQEAYDYFAGSDDFTIYGSYNHTIFAMWMNCLSGTPFSDINLRAALCYAINSDDVLAAVGGEQFARKVYEFACPDTENYNEECETWDSYYNVSDLELAKEYLDAAEGYENHTFQIYYFTGEEPTFNEAISLCVGAALDNLGLKYEIHPVNVIDDVFAQPNADWDICVLTTGGDGGAADYIKTYLNEERYEGCLGNFYDDTLNELYKKTYTESGSTSEGVSELNQYLIDNFYVYGMVERLVYDVWRSSVVEDGSIKTYRTYVIPGAWVYTDPEPES